MKRFKMVFVVSMILLIFAPLGVAADFDWAKDFNFKAEADPDGFRASMGTRFKIGNAEIDAVLNDVTNPADAYMIFRLGEMAHKPAGDVIEKYKSGKGQGWGNIAKSLGIKPGSKEFHALKNNADLSFETPGGKGKGEGEDDGKDQDQLKGEKEKEKTKEKEKAKEKEKTKEKTKAKQKKKGKK